MKEDWRKALDKVRSGAERTIVLAGNPNVGKSCIFNHLTGVGVITANYPGKTTEMNIASSRVGERGIAVIDLPGAYSIGGVSEDQWVARRGLLESDPDVVVCIIDATNLARNLYLALQLIDLGMPLVIGLNLMDQVEKSGSAISLDDLSRLLGGLPVIRTVAVCGQGLDELMRHAMEVADEGQVRLEPPLHYGHDVDDAVSELADMLEELPVEDRPFGLSPRALAFCLVEKDEEVTAALARTPSAAATLEKASALIRHIEAEHGETADLRIARERHGLAGAIAAEVETVSERRKPLSERLWYLSTSPWTGLPILGLVLAAVFGFLFTVGGWLSGIIDAVWTANFSPLIINACYSLLGKGILGRTFVWGLDGGISAALSVGIPYVLTFYFILAVLEDTGYLNSAAFLTDRLMHRLGLHGRAIIPMIAGCGCSVPAIIGTRVLTTKRERIIACALIVFVPCSARTAVILGSVSLYVGWLAAVSIFLVSLLVIIAVGFLLNKVMPGEASGLVMEMFPMRLPRFDAMMKKTYNRFKDFLIEASPIILIGSLILGFLYESGWIWWLAKPLRPVITGWLGLPAFAGVALIFAVLRKELALQLLVTLAIVRYGGQAKDLTRFMDPTQIYVYALVVTLYFPCLATISVLARELDWRSALSISAFTVALATLIGGLAMRLITVFHLL